jgi:hypothetical protein
MSVKLDVEPKWKLIWKFKLNWERLWNHLISVAQIRLKFEFSLVGFKWTNLIDSSESIKNLNWLNFNWTLNAHTIIARFHLNLLLKIFSSTFPKLLELPLQTFRHLCIYNPNKNLQVTTLSEFFPLEKSLWQKCQRWASIKVLKFLHFTMPEATLVGQSGTLFTTRSQTIRTLSEARQPTFIYLFGGATKLHGKQSLFYDSWNFFFLHLN